MDKTFLLGVPLVLGWIADRLLGDPSQLPHPIAFFGKIISKGERTLNKGKDKLIKGGVFSLILIVGCFLLFYFLEGRLLLLSSTFYILFNAIFIFFCLAGKTLMDEVRNVFIAVERSEEDGRKQVARIVGRDTSKLSSQQIRIAALETLSENLSDGVIAPLFWYLILGIPGMITYKMINTLDSMIGYKTYRYKDFGCWAAYIDDIVNYIPARLTALLMILVSGNLSLFSFVKKYGRNHASPNSGFPEAALAGILNCRFGGVNSYFGQLVDKPYIGDMDKIITLADMEIALQINLKSEILMVAFVILLGLLNIFPLI